MPVCSNEYFASALLNGISALTLPSLSSSMTGKFSKKLGILLTSNSLPSLSWKAIWPCQPVGKPSPLTRAPTLNRPPFAGLFPT